MTKSPEHPSLDPTVGIEILHELIDLKTCRNYGTIVYAGSCRVFIINQMRLAGDSNDSNVLHSGA